MPGRRVDDPIFQMAPLEQGKRILGLDFGRKRVGVAVSDALLMMAHSRETLHYRNRNELWARLQGLIQQEGIGLIVVGMPRRLSGAASDMTAQVQAFTAALQERSNLPVITWDERLSSRQAERMLNAAESRKRRPRGAVDQVAAVLILQSYLDSLALSQAST